MSHEEQEESAPAVDSPVTGMAVDEEEPQPRRPYRRYLIAGVLVVLLAAGINVLVNQHRGNYDTAALDGLCDKIDMTVLRDANPFATWQTSTEDDSDGDAYEGGRVQYCNRAYVGDDEEAVLSKVRVAAAVYPSQRDAAVAYNQAAGGDIGTEDSIDDARRFDGPLVFVVYPGDKVGQLHPATGTGAPEAFCATVVPNEFGNDNSRSGYMLAARDSNLLVEVYVRLRGQRMDLARRRWAAATILHQVLPLPHG